MKAVYLVADDLEELWQRQDFSRIFRESVTSRNATEHFDYIRAHGGEKIAFVNEYGEILGWIGLVPDADSRGEYLTLSGHEVRSDCRRRGIGYRLLEEARAYARRRGVRRLRVGTSPLLTIDASLYVTKLRARYTWNDRVKLADGTRWPYVLCECDFRNPLSRPPELDGIDPASCSVLHWRGWEPRPRTLPAHQDQLTVLLPPMTRQSLHEAVERSPRFLPVLFALFDDLSARGYGFGWFERTEVEGEPCYYYYMTRKPNLFTF